MGKWYVVYKGHVPGVYEEWEDCKKQVNEFKGNSHKSYKTKAEAEATLQEMGYLLTKTLVTKMHTVIDVSL